MKIKQTHINMEILNKLDLLSPDALGYCYREKGHTPNIENNDAFRGPIPFKPTVNFRFICGKLSTNIVKEILEETEDGGKFLTHSDSIYVWKLLPTNK